MPEPNRRFVVMWSFPGCLPEMEPAAFNNLADARDFITHELDCLHELYLCSPNEDESSAATAFHHIWYDFCHASINDLPMHRTSPDGLVYSISLE